MFNPIDWLTASICLVFHDDLCNKLLHAISVYQYSMDRYRFFCENRHGIDATHSWGKLYQWLSIQLKEHSFVIRYIYTVIDNVSLIVYGKMVIMIPNDFQSLLDGLFFVEMHAVIYIIYMYAINSVRYMFYPHWVKNIVMYIHITFAFSSSSKKFQFASVRYMRPSTMYFQLSCTIAHLLWPSM